MADQSISLATGATLDGRAMARIGAVTLDSTTITVPNTTITSITLMSAAEVSGPYATASGQTVNLATDTITVPMSGQMQYYSILSDPSVAITSITTSGNNVVIVYK